MLVAQLLEDSSAAISVLQLPLLYFLLLFYASRDSLRRPLKSLGDSRSLLPKRDSLYSHSMMLAKDKNSRVSGEQALAILLIQLGTRAHYYMNIMKEAYFKMRNHGKSDVYD